VGQIAKKLLLFTINFFKFGSTNSTYVHYKI
jgi:hypothetical protein